MGGAGREVPPRLGEKTEDKEDLKEELDEYEATPVETLAQKMSTQDLIAYSRKENQANFRSLQTDLRKDHEKTKGLAAKAVTLGDQSLGKLEGKLESLEKRVTKLERGESTAPAPDPWFRAAKSRGSAASRASSVSGWSVIGDGPPTPTAPPSPKNGYEQLGGPKADTVDSRKGSNQRKPEAN